MAIIQKTLKSCSHLHDENNIVTDEECNAHGVAYETFILESDNHGAAGELEEAPIADDGEIEMVEVPFEFSIPDSWRSGSFDENKSNLDIYRGPKWLFIDVRKEHEYDTKENKISSERKGQLAGSVVYSMKDQCIPCAPDHVRFRIDADKNPMLASILYMNGDDIQRDHGANQKWIVEYETPEGFMNTKMMLEDDLIVRNIYDQNDVMYDFDNSQFMLAVQTHFSGDEEITWEDIRTHRNVLLKASDGSISEDMPQFMKDDMLNYRQLLRDVPTVLSEYSPADVLSMFPAEPYSTITADAAIAKSEGLVT